MVDHSDRNTNFAALFQTITDESMHTEQQPVDIPLRNDEHREEADIQDNVDTTARAQGFDAVIEVSETN